MCRFQLSMLTAGTGRLVTVAQSPDDLAGKGALADESVLEWNANWNLISIIISHFFQGHPKRSYHFYSESSATTERVSATKATRLRTAAAA
jgi:hypothetical protein